MIDVEGCLGSFRTPEAGMGLEKLWEERAGGIIAQGRWGLPVWAAHPAPILFSPTSLEIQQSHLATGTLCNTVTIVIK